MTHFNLEDFKFYTDFNLGKTSYHFLYKKDKIEGDIIIGYQNVKDKTKPYISHIDIIKGEDLLEDEDIVDLESFIEDNIDSVIGSKKINEDSATGGPASAGMGAVVSAQPSSNPGATVGADWISGGGTTGSGDVSIPYNPGGADRMFQKVPVSSFSNSNRFIGKTKNKKTNIKDLTQPVLDFKPTTKVMSYDDFIKKDINVIKRNKK